MENHLSRPEFSDAIETGYGEMTRFSTTLGYRMMYVAVPVVRDGKTLGAVRVSLPLSDVENLAGTVRNVIIISVLITLILTSLAAWLIARRFTRSLREVTAATQRVAAGNYGQRIETKTNDETAELARAFNRMAEKMAATVDSLSEDRARLETVLDNMADGVIMTDTEGTTLMANRAVGTIFRVNQAEMGGKQIIELLREHEIHEVFRSCLTTGRLQIVQFESSLLHKFLRTLAVPVAGRKLRGVLLLFQDLTEVRNLQTMRRELIGNLSHDFKTPLAGIKAMVETLQDGALDDREAAVNFLSRIDGEVDRLSQMVGKPPGTEHQPGALAGYPDGERGQGKDAAGTGESYP
jgi:two-component system phosphate regulon sensor histidine kinase PhoR